MAQPQSKAVLILVLGIVSILLTLGCFTGIPAWILGKQELDAISRGELPTDGRTMAQIGMILGMVATIISIIIGIVTVIVFIPFMLYKG